MKKHLSYHLSHITSHPGFTLIELLVVIAIIALMIGIALPNFVGARERARDSKKKQELQQVKNALRLYYNDYQQYPGTSSSSGPKYLSAMLGCGTTGILTCPSTCALADFAAGGTTDGCGTIYMKKLPLYNNASPQYVQTGSGDDFRLGVVLENVSDPDLDASHLKCSSVAGLSCSGTTYCVCAD